MYRLFFTTLSFACCAAALAQSLPQVGNARDPLNAQFAANTPVAPSPYSEMVGDARLNDVCFINALHGWAVGDRGVIWTTANGGANWQLQETPIDCTLRSVQFIDESFGIAVGHYWFPQACSAAHSPTRPGRGVILTTRDGGKTWQLRHTPELPQLFHVKIFDAGTFLIAGATSERCPSGLLISRDGGQNWRPIQSELSDGFIAADFYDTRIGIGIGFHGILQQYQNGITASQTETFGLRHVSAIKVNRANGSSEVTGWAVGDHGLILSSVDRGYRWGVVPGTLPGNAAEIVDLKTIEAQGKNLWVAGNPGTCIYMSNDAGQTWKTTQTGVSGAIHKIVFADANTGWAVGDLGTILSTQNGGQTWQVQRTGGSKLAILGLFGEYESIPLEVFAALSANQSYLSGCNLLFRNEYQSSDQENRLHESMVRIGGSIGSELGTFPIRHHDLWKSPEKLEAHIQQMTDGRGMGQLRERLVAAIRQWKPEVLLTSNFTNFFTDSAIEGITLHEVTKAVEQAEDPSAYPHHLTELGLSAWKVKKVYLATKNSTLGDVHLTPSEPTVRFGMPLEQLTFVSRSLLEAKCCPPILGFINATQEYAGKDFFSGISLVHGEDGRREMLGIYSEFHDEHQRRTLQRRTILGILRNTEKGANLVPHAADLTRKLDPDSAVQVLLEMANQFHQEGNWFAATETCLVLTRQYPQHPLVRQAFVRLMEYAVSGEILAAEALKNVAVVKVDEWVMDPLRPGQRILQTSVMQEPVQKRTQTDPKRDRALLLGQYLEQNIPDLADEAVMRFALASALRKYGWERDAAKFYHMRGNSQFDDVWGIRARTEYWLTIPDKTELPIEQRELPMPALVSIYTNTKPFLDGKFDDEKDQDAWKRSNVYSLTPAKPRQRLTELLQPEKTIRRIGIIREGRQRAMSQNFGTQAMFLHDSEYWYIALRCPKVPGFVYPPAASKQRMRNVGMSDQDRVEILIDVDRDYSTYYSLTIDSRGWVTDACCGDQNWNPQWHIARHEDTEAWYIEAAIPRSVLSPVLSESPIQSSVIFGIAIRRLVPDAGIECWNAENSFDLTEGFGLLVFP